MTMTKKLMKKQTSDSANAYEPYKPQKDEYCNKSAPICVTNAHSLYNKSTNFKHILHELGVEIALVSETWERQEMSLTDLVDEQL